MASSAAEEAQQVRVKVEEEEEEARRAKRVRILVDEDEQQAKEDRKAAAGAKEAEETSQGEAEAEASGDGEEEVPLDPRRAEIEALAKEFGEDEEDIQVVIGPMNSFNAQGGAQQAGSADGAQGDGKAKSHAFNPNLPRNRFSGSSLTASLWIPLTPEVEEALRVTGVTPSNYPQKLNPGGVVKHRSALDYDLDELESQRWRDPGANQSDFFNYGLNEQTWKEYAARQVAVRLSRMQKAKEATEVQHEVSYQMNEHS